MPRLDWESTLTDRAVWLLDLDVSGARFRFGSDEVEVADRDGVSQLYRGGLTDLAVERSGVQGLTVEVSSDDDWAELLQQGATLTGIRAELRRWWPGQILEEAETLFVGEVEQPEYGPLGEPVTLPLRTTQDTGRESEGFPPSTARADESTWPVQAAPFVLPATDIGSYYPWVIGAPGHNAASLIPYDAVIGITTEYSAGASVTILVAGHPIHATTVRLKDPSTTATMLGGADATITQMTDSRGRIVSVTSTSGLGLGHDPGSRWGIGFQDDTTYGCGVVYEGEPLRTAGKVIEWAMQTWSPTVRVDRSRQIAQRVFLDGYRIDTWVNEPTTGLEFVESTIAPLLPVERVDGVGGTYWQVMRYDATAQDAIANLIEGHNCERTGRVGYSQDNIINEVVVEYGRAGAESKTYKMRAVTGRSGKLEADPVLVTAQRVLVSANDDDRVLGSMLARISQQRYGLRSQRIRTSAVWDDQTAVRIALSKIARHAWPRRVVRYTVGPEWDSLQRGDIVTLTDAELYLTSAVCIVTGVTLSAQTVLALEVLDDPTGGSGRRS